MQLHEIAYYAIIEDLARAGKILDPEDLAITHLNTLPYIYIYSPLIQLMEPVLANLTSQNIKVKVREEEQRLKNVENGGNHHGLAQSVVVVANNAQQGQPNSNSPKQAQPKKKGKCYHCGLKGNWKNECRKGIAEEKGTSNENGSATNGTGNIVGTAMSCAALAIVANIAIIQQLLYKSSTETLWIFDSGANRQMFPHRREFLEYTQMGLIVQIMLLESDPTHSVSLRQELLRYIMKREDFRFSEKLYISLDSGTNCYPLRVLWIRGSKP